MHRQRTDWRSWTAPEDAHAHGRALRDIADHAVHRDHAPTAGRPTITEYIRATSAGRVPSLIPLRVERMLASPFSFFRGAAGLMAHDLADDPTSGITAQLCGDAHAANVGLFGRKDGEIVIDFNDFDETAPGPWEWDVKRLATSLVLAGRVAGVSEKHCRSAVHDTVELYRRAAAALAAQPFLDSWYALADEKTLRRIGSHDLIDELQDAAAKARKNTSAKAAAKWTRRDGNGDWRFVADPPTLTPVSAEVADAVVAGLDEYTTTLPDSLAALIRRYTVYDVAFRVVGTGSVGLRNYLVLMRGNGDEPMILQVKQAIGSALAPYLGLAPSRHEGERVVRGSRLVQADTDVLLGWTSVQGRDYIVRQFRNRKGKIDPSALSHHDLDDYGRLAGALLARAHARSLDVRVLAGYCSDGESLDESLVRYAFSYADQTERDFEELGRAVRRGEVRVG
ncbi:DUF2252 domain-containing protein [Actinorhabdospora filicis]|uniref:DUF2252 domain-containing protein n=1 Tax=Actinorhabdospora filicis TaxID=1785913 RepID=UPI002555350E|nr:DUF2252 domain-containing protein [Actinorhabdospora filicis]